MSDFKNFDVDDEFADLRDDLSADTLDDIDVDALTAPDEADLSLDDPDRLDQPPVQQANQQAQAAPRPVNPAQQRVQQAVRPPAGKPGAKSAIPAKAPAKAAAQPAKAAAVQPSDKPMKGLGAVVARNEFYRDGYRLWQRVAGLQALAIIVLTFVVFMVVTSDKKEYVYFATTEDGRLVPMVSLTEPNLSKPALTSWVAQAATEVMTFGFHDYRKRLQEASRNFTRTGWASFTEALAKSRIIETVEQNQQVVTATPISAPIITQEGIVNGRYQWMIDLPMAISYQAGSQSRSDNLMLTLVVVRVPKLESPNGVGIEQWVAAPM